MNKSELVEAIASSANISKAETGRILDTFVLTVTEALKLGHDVVIPKFGSFSVGVRAARSGRNPQTGQLISIPRKKTAKFKAGKNLTEVLQEA